jgi:hypothetical protein
MTIFRMLAPGLLWLAISMPAAAPVQGTLAPQAPIVVNPDSVALFEQIPEAYLQAAENTPMFFADRSVGEDISDGLTCLSYTTDELAPDRCRRINHPEPSYEVSPDELNWSRSGGYSRANWQYHWCTELDCFFDLVDQSPGDEVVGLQHSYLDGPEKASWFFQPQAGRLDIYDLDAFEAAHPDQVFVYATSSLARAIGTADSDSFNQQMRAYATSHGKVLFDIADILSHDPSGNPCYDNRDGVPYREENHPDDGHNYAAICPHYTTEVDGGHLRNVSVGKIRVAKAFWVLMAQLAGWDPGVTPLPIGDERAYLPLLLR